MHHLSERLERYREAMRRHTGLTRDVISSVERGLTQTIAEHPHTYIIEPSNRRCFDQRPSFGMISGMRALNQGVKDWLAERNITRWDISSSDELQISFEDADQAFEFRMRWC